MVTLVAKNQEKVEFCNFLKLCFFFKKRGENILKVA